MSAILSADDLNDFISPGVACIKPVETLPKQVPESLNPYEVTTEDKVAASELPPPPAQISLTDCLACSGCVTSAEAVLVSLQSHQEVLSTLDSHPEFRNFDAEIAREERVFVASVSPQTRASLAATYGVSEKHAGYMVEQLLSGPEGLRSGGQYKSGFTWVIDTNTVREVCQDAVVEELRASLSPAGNGVSTIAHKNDIPKLPILASACPGWICYAEKTHPHVLPHLSRLKSPQALAGTLLKSVLSKKMGIAPDKVWHLAIMPCFDKKLEASREELTDTYWMSDAEPKRGVRDVDCVITARELLMLADSRGISFPRLPQTPVSHPPFPDTVLDSFLFPRNTRPSFQSSVENGPSGGYAFHIVQSWQARIPGSRIQIDRGRNPDVVEYALMRDEETLLKTARYFGFRNIQNLVRKLKPQKASRLPGAKLGGAENRRAKSSMASGGRAGNIGEYAYVEVMACPGGCTNGGGQIKVDDVSTLLGATEPGAKMGPAEQKAWLTKVDEAYYSADSASDDDDEMTPNDQHTNGSNEETSSIASYTDAPYTTAILAHWTSCTNIDLNKLMYTTYRQVESDVGKEKGTSDIERVAGLASSLGGGW